MSVCVCVCVKHLLFSYKSGISQSPGCELDELAIGSDRCFFKSQGHHNLHPFITAAKPSICGLFAKTDVAFVKERWQVLLLPLCDVTGQACLVLWVVWASFRLSYFPVPFWAHAHTHSQSVIECWDRRPSLNSDGGGAGPAVPLLAMETAPGLQPPCCQQKLKKESCCCHGNQHHLTYSAAVAPLWVGPHNMSICVEKIRHTGV